MAVSKLHGILGWATGRLVENGARPLALALTSCGVTASHPAGATPPRSSSQPPFAHAPILLKIKSSLTHGADIAACVTTRRVAQALPSTPIPKLPLQPASPRPLEAPHATIHRQGPVRTPVRPPSPPPPLPLPVLQRATVTVTARPIPSSTSRTFSSPLASTSAQPQDPGHVLRTPSPNRATATTTTATTTPHASSPASPPEESHQHVAAPVGGGAALLVLHSRARSARASLERSRSSLLAVGSLLADLGAKFNMVTGYDAIEQLKGKVDEATRRLADAREDLRDSKALYEARVLEQGDVQRQQMALLQRKSSWQAADLERFTELCRQEHRLEMEVAQAKAAYGGAAEALEACHDQVAEGVRERYSAETMWSDKIRRASTWWTAGLMVLQLVSFLSVYLIMEPIKARRLRNHVEEVLRMELANVRLSLASLESSVAQSSLGTSAANAEITSAAVGMGPVLADSATAGGTDSIIITAEGRSHTASNALMDQVRQVKRHLAALEKGLAAAAAAAGDPVAAAQAPAPAGLPPLLDASHPSAGDAVSNMELDAITVDGDAPGVRAWHRRLGDQLLRVATTPEVRTATAAFAGAALGVGLLWLLLRDG